MSILQGHIDAELPDFLRKKAKAALPKIDLELLGFYKNSEYGDKNFAERLLEIHDAGILFFEVPTRYIIDDYTTTRHFSLERIEKLNKNYKKYEYLLDSADVIILYHATSTAKDAEIKKNGLQPPANTGTALTHPEKNREAYIRHLGEERFELFKKSYEESRQFSVYFSTANGEMFTNADASAYMELAVEKFGGDERLYRCIVPKDMLLPDEDAKGSNTWIESINELNSAKINGGLNPEEVFIVEEKSYPFRMDEKSPTALELEGLFRSNYQRLNLYLTENPIGNILSA